MMAFQLKLYYIHHGPLHAQRRFGIQHQGEFHRAPDIHAGMQHGNVVQSPDLRAFRGKAQGMRIGKPAAGRLLEQDGPRSTCSRLGTDIQCVLDYVGPPRSQLDSGGSACIPADVFSGAAAQLPWQAAVWIPRYPLLLAHQMNCAFLTCQRLVRDRRGYGAWDRAWRRTRRPARLAWR